MRRKDREITDIQKIDEILKKAKVIRVSVYDGEFPYIVPLNYGYELDGDKIIFYLHSAKEGRKIDLFRANNKVGFELDLEGELVGEGKMACIYTYEYSSIIGNGVIAEVESLEDKEAILNKLMHHYTGKSNFEYKKSSLENVCILTLTSISYTAKSNM